MAVSGAGAGRDRGRRAFRSRARALRRPARSSSALSISDSTSSTEQLVSLCRTNEACRRLSKLPGVGPVIATALVAAVDDGRHFRSGRELAAWIGLVPRQYTTGGKPRLGGIGRRANHYLRRQMIHGARAVMFRLAKRDDRRSQWLKELAARRASIGRSSRSPIRRRESPGPCSRARRTIWRPLIATRQR